MFKTNGPNPIEHADADRLCTSPDQLHKADMNGLPSAVFSSQNTSLLNKPNEVRSTDKYRDNVISITTAFRPSGAVKIGQMKAVRVNSIKFIYPMLECS
jgi:hypothetical protein